MTEFDAANLDDEWLSAYLDDELGPEERARVEARLAADPAARQLLDELRAVSQAMKALPPATLGEDLREPVLRRAERALLRSQPSAAGEVASATGAGGLVDLLLRIPIGRSRRAWTWAAAALAAGLLLMIIEREPAPDTDLPAEVARREAAPAAPAVAPSASEPGAGGFGGAMVSEELSVDKAPPAASAQPSSPSDPAAPLLVVHVNARPEVLEQKLFDAVLARNGIVVEEPSAPATDDSTERRLAESSDVEVVLVEAPAAQIAGCLAEIDADRDNYLGIDVDDQSVRAQGAAGEAKPLHWKQHERGVVPAKQKLQVAADNNVCLESDGKQFAFGRGRDVPALDRSRDVAKDAAAQAAQSRAVRFEPLAESSSVAASGQIASDAVSPPPAPTIGFEVPPQYRQKRGVLRRGAAQLDAKADLLQVLFVLSADEGPPPAETPSSDEGLKIDD